MSENREPESNGNPWMKSLLVWGGIFLALLLVVSMFGGPRDAAGTQMRYSDFREKVAEGTVEEVQTSADRIREAMELQAQTVTMITAAVDETALAADSMSSTIAAIRSDTENVAKDIDQVEQGFGRFSEQIANFKASAKAFVNGMAA